MGNWAKCPCFSGTRGAFAPTGPAIEYNPPHGRYSIDILSRLGVAFCYEDIEWEELGVDGIHVRVATPSMLYRMKKDTVRPRDRADAAWIRQAFGIGED